MGGKQKVKRPATVIKQIEKRLEKVLRIYVFAYLLIEAELLYNLNYSLNGAEGRFAD